MNLGEVEGGGREREKMEGGLGCLKLCQLYSHSIVRLSYLNLCTHCRDIAARNVLLTQTYEVKVSDFGMSDERTVIQDEKLDKVTDLRINNAYFFVFIAS